MSLLFLLSFHCRDFLTGNQWLQITITARNKAFGINPIRNESIDNRFRSHLSKTHHLRPLHAMISS